MKKLIVLFGSVLLVHMTANTVMGQQQVMFTQYMFNALAVNPAYAGHDGALSITALTRHQWLGIEVGSRRKVPVPKPEHEHLPRYLRPGHYARS